MSEFDTWFHATLKTSGITEAVTDPATIRQLVVLLGPPLEADETTDRAA